MKIKDSIMLCWNGFWDVLLRRDMPEFEFSKRYVYVVTHHYGSFDSMGSYIAGVFSNPIDAENEKRKMLDYVNEIKGNSPKYDFDNDEYWSFYIKHEKEMETSDVLVKEWLLK